MTKRAKKYASSTAGTGKAAAPAAPVARGTLLGWGDSWLCYRPASQVFKESNLMKFLQEDGFTLAAQPIAQAGMLLATMASRPIDDQIYVLLDDLLSRNAAPQAIVLSASGNDCVKAALLQYVVPKANGGPPVNQAAWDAHLQLLRSYFMTILAKFQTVASRHGTTVPVLLHGYDHPIADGRFLFLPIGGRDAWIFGWLNKQLGYTVEESTGIMKKLIDELNDMMASLASADVHHVNLTSTLRDELGKGMLDQEWFSTGYKTAWDNELHPTPEGFRALTNKVTAKLDLLVVV